jgi:hypothetical protein
MNALVGHKAKSNLSLFLIFSSEGANNGRRKDGGNFANSGGPRHPGRVREFDIFHDCSMELQLSWIMTPNFRTGWQRRVINQGESKWPGSLSRTASTSLI